jgi:hypothetical protein
MVIKTNQLILYKANDAVRFEIHTKHSMQSKHHVEFLNIKPGFVCKESARLQKVNGIFYYYYLFFTASGLTSGGSSTVHIYTQTVHSIQRTKHM